MEITHYLTPTGHDPFQKWLNSLHDMHGRIEILRRLDRAVKGNFGDHKFCHDGVWEMRQESGPGYRIYYFEKNPDQIVILRGGDKRTQDRDIAEAAQYREDYLQRVQ